MFKKIKILAIIPIIIISLNIATFATGEATADYADILASCGFFRGTQLGYELERAPTRIEALVMIVRITHNEQWALNEDWESFGAHTFTDVPKWADGYVSCAVYAGLIKGISETEFGSNIPVSAEQFVTMLLRILDYNDDYGHFSWDNPWWLSNHIGVTEGLNTGDTFTRSDMVYLSYRALSTNMKNSSFSLYYYYFIYKRPPSEVIDDDIFIAQESNICIDKFDSHKTLKVGETAYSMIMCKRDGERLFTIQNTNPNIADYQIDYMDGNDYYASIAITGLEKGHTTLIIVFADGGQDSHAIGLIDIFIETETGDGSMS